MTRGCGFRLKGASCMWMMGLVKVDEDHDLEGKIVGRVLVQET